jgi:LacI family transcriptional regulator
MSIQALAHSLGLSTSTVSRALNGYQDVSTSTRERVQEAAKRMNYAPHPMAHRLATGKTGAIALVSSVQAGNYLDATFAALMSGVAEVLRARGYFTLSVGLPMGEDEMPELQRLLKARLVDGVILARTRTDDPRVSLLQKQDIPFITHGRTLKNQEHPWVDTDNEQAFYRATKQLIDLGHQRIALINGLSHMTFAMLRKQGFHNALKVAGLPVREQDVLHTEVTAQAGRQAMEQLLKNNPSPSAVLCANDAQAMGAMVACKAQGLQVGADISIMGYGNSEAAMCVEPPLASIDHAIVENGRHLADLLLKRMAGEPVEQLNRLEPINIIMRPSVGPPKA